MAYISFQPNDYFNTKLYTGTGSSNALTGVGFQPDLAWIKQRGGTTDHHLYDAIRGVTKALASNNTDEETTKATGLTAFGADGFTLGADSGVNGSSNTYVGWSWKGGGGQGSSNTDGSINTTYTSANTTSGFSISTYTGTGSNGTIGHGLGAVPKMFIVKRTDGTDGWYMFNSNLGSNDAYIMLDSNNASSTSNGSTLWNSTAPTNQVFSLGTNSVVNYSGRTYVAYCFAEKKGFSKFGSYTGNGNNDGSFIYLGFKPAFFLIKRTDTAESWIMTDIKRGTNNDWNYLLADTNAAEVDGDLPYEFLSNGVKMRGTTQNGSGNTFVYMAFAEEPLVSSNGVPAVAR